MNIKNNPLIQFEEIDFDHSRQLLKVDFFDYMEEHRTVYSDFWDFEQWVNKNNYLSIDTDSRNPLTGRFSHSSRKITIEDLLTDDLYTDYRDKLAEDFIKELLNLQHVAENLKNRILIKRFREEVLTISKELDSSFKISA